MIQSRQKVKDLCDDLMKVRPMQILIDLVQEDIEELVSDDDATPDDIIATSYKCDILKDVYNPEFKEDINYLIALSMALESWGSDATFANKALGFDPNE